MRHFVVNGCRTADVIALSDFGAEDQDIFMESYATNVLHGAPVVFSHCNLIVLAKGISQAESLLKVGEALLGDLKNVLGINVFKE